MTKELDIEKLKRDNSMLYMAATALLFELLRKTKKKRMIMQIKKATALVEKYDLNLTLGIDKLDKENSLLELSLTKEPQ